MPERPSVGSWPIAMASTEPRRRGRTCWCSTPTRLTVSKLSRPGASTRGAQEAALDNPSWGRNGAIAFLDPDAWTIVLMPAPVLGSRGALSPCAAGQFRGLVDDEGFALLSDPPALDEVG